MLKWYRHDSLRDITFDGVIGTAERECAMAWYILSNKVKQGPFSDEQMGTFVQNGQLKEDDYVWKPGLLKWMSIKEVPELMEPAPMPKTSGKSEHEQKFPPETVLNSAHEQDYDEIEIEPTNPNNETIPSVQKSYVARHWRGELSLSLSYWVNTFLLTMVLAAGIKAIPWDELMPIEPKLVCLSGMMLWPIFWTVGLWQLVGTWRSASASIAQGKSKVWGNLTRIIIIFGIITLCANAYNVGIPQIGEYTLIILDRDPIGKYQLRIIRDATELELSGPITFGLTDEVSRVLDAHPSIKLIHLNSIGGRVYEARKLRDVISYRHLSTYTSTGCFSACTLAYAAGKERLIATEGNLGFHRYSFAGIGDKKSNDDYELDKKDWASRGFSPGLIQKAFATPNDDMWTPTHSELLAARFITRYPNINEVAVSGFNSIDEVAIESELAKHPLYAAIKECEPQAYHSIMSEVTSGIQKGKSMTEMGEKVLPLIQSMVLKKIPFASDSAVRNFAKLFLDQYKILSPNPSVCYSYLFGEATNFDYQKYFSKEMQQREFLILEEIVRSSTGNKFRPPEEKQIEKQLSNVLKKLTARYGEDVAMLANPELGKANKSKMCQMTADLYQAILQLQEKDSAALLRYLFYNS